MMGCCSSTGGCCWTSLFGEGVLSEGWPLRRALVITCSRLLLCPGDAIGDGIGALGYSGVVVALPTLETAALDFAFFVWACFRAAASNSAEGVDLGFGLTPPGFAAIGRGVVVGSGRRYGCGLGNGADVGDARIGEGALGGLTGVKPNGPGSQLLDGVAGGGGVRVVLAATAAPSECDSSARECDIPTSCTFSAFGIFRETMSVRFGVARGPVDLALVFCLAISLAGLVVSFAAEFLALDLFFTLVVAVTAVAS